MKDRLLVIVIIVCVFGAVSGFAWGLMDGIPETTHEGVCVKTMATPGDCFTAPHYYVILDCKDARYSIPVSESAFSLIEIGYRYRIKSGKWGDQTIVHLPS